MENTGTPRGTVAPHPLGPRPGPGDPFVAAAKAANIGARLEIEMSRRRDIRPIHRSTADAYGPEGRLARLEQGFAAFHQIVTELTLRIDVVEADVARLRKRVDDIDAVADYAAELGESAARGRGGWAA